MPHNIDTQPGSLPRKKRLAIAAALLTLAVVIAVVGWLLWQLRSIDENLRPSPQTASAVRAQLSRTPSPPSAEDTRPPEPTYVLVMGGTGGDGAGLDTLLLARLDAATAHASVLWIPPKALVVSETDAEGVLGSASDAFVDGGPAGAIAHVKALTGLPVHHYVRFETGGLVETVDAMGGVWVDPTLTPEASSSPTEPPTARKGERRLDGKAVLAYAASTSLTDTEDSLDGLLVLNATLTQARERLLAPGAVPLLLAASRSTETDMGSRGLLDLGQRMQAAAGGEVDQSWLSGPLRNGWMRLNPESHAVRECVGEFASGPATR